MIITFYSLQGEPHNEPFGSACTSFVIVLICALFVLICFVLKRIAFYNRYLYCADKKNRGTRAASCSLKNKCFWYCIVPICFNPKEQIKLVDLCLLFGYNNPMCIVLM